jgi:DNA-binding NarL/FixJ family response regulator
MESGKKIRIGIADYHAVLRESLSALLSLHPDFEVVGTASNGNEALELVEKLQPDVLVLDLFMSDTDGFEVLRRLDRANSKVASLVLTASDSQADYVQVVRLGGHGLVLKSDAPETLYTAIRTVASGELAFSEDVAQGVLMAMTAESQPEQPISLHRLSERERQVAGLVSHGMKNKDIAVQLTISENTVKRHLRSIFSKTGARDRLELAVIALTEKSEKIPERIPEKISEKTSAA